MESNNEDQKKIVIISDDDESKKPWAASLASYNYYVKKFKYWIIGASILVGLLGYASLEYVYNPKKETFKIGFAYKKSDFISKTDSSGNISYYYPNGDQLNYQSIISYDNLKTVVEQSKKNNQAEYAKNNPTATEEQIAAISGDFDSIDYEKISTENLLSISQITDTSILNTYDYLGYDISGYTYDFPSKDLLQDFVVALISYGRMNLMTTEFNPNSYLDGFEVATNPYSRFKNQLTMLTNEVDFLFSSYTSLESIYGKTTAISEDSTETLNNAFNKFKAKIGMSSEDTDTTLSEPYSLEGSLSYSETNEGTTTTYTYVYVDKSVTQQSYLSYFKQKESSIETRLKEVNNDYADEEQHYNELSEQLKDTSLSTDEKSVLRNALSASYNKLTSYRTEQKNYDKQIEMVESQMNFVNSIDKDDWSNWSDSNTTLAETDLYKNYKEILAEIKNQYNILTIEANTLKTIYENISTSYLNSNNNSVSTLYRGVMTTEGSISWYIGAIGGIVLGFVISSLVALAFGQSERRRLILLGEPDPIISVKKEEVKEQAPSNEEVSTPSVDGETKPEEEKKDEKTDIEESADTNSETSEEDE